jgi:hypothetical protein
MRKFKEWWGGISKAQKLLIIGITVSIWIYLLFSPNPAKELPRGTLTGNEWFVEKGNPNDMYDASIWLKFQGGTISSTENTVEAWEGGISTKSCVCDGGTYKINDERNQIIISGLRNENCPWMNELNGTYRYVYDASRDGHNKFMFKKGSLVITHLFDENR